MNQQMSLNGVIFLVKTTLCKSGEIAHIVLRRELGKTLTDVCSFSMKTFSPSEDNLLPSLIPIESWRSKYQRLAPLIVCMVAWDPNMHICVKMKMIFNLWSTSLFQLATAALK